VNTDPCPPCAPVVSFGRLRLLVSGGRGSDIPIPEVRARIGVSEPRPESAEGGKHRQLPGPLCWAPRQRISKDKDSSRSFRLHRGRFTTLRVVVYGCGLLAIVGDRFPDQPALLRASLVSPATLLSVDELRSVQHLLNELRTADSSPSLLGLGQQLKRHREPLGARAGALRHGPGASRSAAADVATRARARVAELIRAAARASRRRPM